MSACTARHVLTAVIWWLSLSVAIDSTDPFQSKAYVSILNNPDGSSVLRISDANSTAVELLRRPSPLTDRQYHNVTEDSRMANSSEAGGPGSATTDCLVSGELQGKHAGWAALSICPRVQGFLATQHGGYLLHFKRQGESFVERVFDRPRFVPQLHDRNRRSTLDAFHIRVLLLADHSVKQRHASRNAAKNYLHTIMNIVHHVFHDQSLGHAVSVSLAGIVFLTRRESKAMNSSTICSWQHFLRKPKVVPPHDTVVYFTRSPVCPHESARNCQHTVGYSLVGSMCDRAASCIAVKDQGLISAFTIAHEIGHSLGLTHDGLNDACPANMFVMSPEVVTLSQPFQWSPCSRKEFTTLVRSGHLHCLRSKPLPQSLSGHQYTSDEQCRLRHGPTATNCTREMTVCQLLWCRIGPGECTTDGHPPADGTECLIPGTSTQGVCYRESCVSRNSTALQPVEGGWSKWSDWSTCSCSCGTGIAASSRNCTSPVPRNGGRPCVGVYIRYKTCNTHKCAVEHVVQTQNQCQAKNSHWTTLSLVEVHHMALNPCQLHCITNDSSILANVAPVKDGTHCWSDKNDVCIKGECVPVGCDLQLNSGVVLDQCGVCGGNGSSCISVSRVILTGNDIGMRHVITFPIQATHAVLVLQDSSTVLLLKEVVSETSWLLGAESSFTIGGVKWTWKHSGTRRSLIAPGPIAHSVIVMIYSLTVNVKVQYSFVLPLGVPGIHQWQETADKGEMVCMDLSNGTLQSEKMCSSKKLLSSISFAASNARQGELDSYSWWKSEWSQCLGVCGQGQQVRAVFCQGRDSYIINDTYCSAPMPNRTRHCSITNECLYSWKTDKWSNCSTTCGSGNQTRNVYCVTLYGQKVNSAFCVSSLKPVESTKCFNTNSCGQWKTSEWAECQVTYCGTGKQTRDVSCVSKSTPESAHTTHHCLQQERPQVERLCSVPCDRTTPSESPCVDSLSPEYCRLVVQHHCSNQEFAIKCCKSCLGQQQP